MRVFVWVSSSFWLGPSAILGVFHWGRAHREQKDVQLLSAHLHVASRQYRCEIYFF